MLLFTAPQGSLRLWAYKGHCSSVALVQSVRGGKADRKSAGREIKQLEMCESSWTLLCILAGFSFPLCASTSVRSSTQSHRWHVSEPDLSPFWCQIQFLHWRAGLKCNAVAPGRFLITPYSSRSFDIHHFTVTVYLQLKMCSTPVLYCHYSVMLLLSICHHMALLMLMPC